MRTIIFVAFFMSYMANFIFISTYQYEALTVWLISVNTILNNHWILWLTLLTFGSLLLLLWMYCRKNYQEILRKERLMISKLESEANLSGKKTREEHAPHLVQLYQELTLANQDIEIFLYKAYHNFLGPIATIRGICNVAVLDGQEENGDTYFSQVSQVANNMQTMLEKLLEVSVIHDHSLDVAPLPLSSFLVDYQKKQPRTEQSIQAHFHLSLPNTVQVYADPFLLSTTIEKIISSAHHFRATKAHTLAEIFVTYHETPDYDVIHLKEYDLALPTDTIDNLFKMFYRSTFSPDDHGLGFYASRYALRRMGGDIAIESGAGYIIFCLKLPKFRIQSTYGLDKIRRA
uniref:histidine kinase n=1 Tax=Roseihalotalea indica TaxID=2867963 RepID=A0AA49GTJ9_9BACT|nr:HAMP domain-containing sensor histidine kinase [Tunicatimonas sp. TK19036]